VTANQWLMSSNAGASFTPSATYVPTAPNAPARVFGAGVCDGEDPTQPTLLVAFGDQSVVRYAADGTVLSPWAGPGAGMLNGVGCVSDQTGRRFRTSMINEGSNVQSQEIIRIDEPTGPIPQVWLGLPIGLDFTTRPVPGPQPFVATAYDVTAFALTRLDLNGTDGSHSVRLLSTEPVPGAPWSCGAGDIDGDGLLDVACALVVPQAGATPLPTLGLYVSLGRGHGSLQHLAGVYVLDPGTHRTPQVWLGDFNGDGRDDIVIGEEPPVGVGNVSNVEIYPSGP
jgi:hypothetical protein